MLSVRPKVAELAFQLFGRALHPELFEVYKTRTIKRGDYEAKLDITSAGHIVTWKHRGLTLTEVACSATHPLPEKRKIIAVGRDEMERTLTQAEARRFRSLLTETRALE